MAGSRSRSSRTTSSAATPTCWRQVRNGGINFFTPSALVIATLVPVAAINAVGFAFADYDQVWKAMDGELGAHVRAAIAKVGLHTLREDVGQRLPPDHQRRQADRERQGHGRPEDPRAGEPAQHLHVQGARRPRRPACSSAKSIRRCRPRIVDAQENPLPIIQVAKLYEVQKYCALSNHIWDGFWFIANGRAWNGLPADLKTIVANAINDAGMKQREDIKTLNATVQADLQRKGLTFNKPHPDSFRAKLRDAGFYGEWKGRFGDEAWGLLEGAVGKLA